MTIILFNLIIHGLKSKFVIALNTNCMNRLSRYIHVFFVTCFFSPYNDNILQGLDCMVQSWLTGDLWGSPLVSWRGVNPPGHGRIHSCWPRPLAGQNQRPLRNQFRLSSNKLVQLQRPGLWRFSPCNLDINVWLSTQEV